MIMTKKAELEHIQANPEIKASMEVKDQSCRKVPNNPREALKDIDHDKSQY